jgi:tetratricopeptide (TPR) repeat protein
MSDLEVFIIGMEAQKDNAQRSKEDEDFMQWLSPSYWLAEAQLYNMRACRGKNSLQWARNMPEFRSWRMSDANDMESKERILWVRGTLGVGKSVMAGYFIDLLQHLHPTSTVAYFFCKGGQNGRGLTKARDILGTLAYQCIKDNKGCRSVLEELRKKKFQLDDILGVGFLFQNLLLEPLRLAKGEIYIVIDGLDEADLTTKDVAERAGRSEIEILLQCLASLPSTRLLFVSRPNADVSRILPISTTKTISKNENFDDIDAYVKETIAASSKTLKLHFSKEGIDPIDFFHEKGNSIFLWVVLVLQQLAEAKSTSLFKKYLSGFSAASGDMEELYSSLLSKYQEEESRWVKEILKWLVIAKKNFTAKELKEAVELSLDDQLPEFNDFLEVECGSIVHLLQPSPDARSEMEAESSSDSVEGSEAEMETNSEVDTGSSFTVQLIHETLRSYLTTPEHCPTGFRVNEEVADCEALGVCLRLLSAAGTTNSNLTQYAAMNWESHLPNVNKSQPMHQGTLADIYQFFHSDGGRMWIKLRLLNEHFTYRSPYYFTREEEEPSLQNLYQCLVRLERFDLRSNGEHVKTGQHNLVSSTAVGEWASEIMKTPQKLEEHVGKAYAEVWLYEKLPAVETSRAFWCSMKHYCKAKGVNIEQLTDLHPLATDQFSAIASWVNGIQLKRIANVLGLALAFYELHMWTEAAQCFRLVTDADDGRCRERFEYLGQACANMGDYDGAIKTFNFMTQHVLATHPEEASQWYSLGLAYKSKGDWNGAVRAIEKALEVGSGYLHSPRMFLSLAELYGEKEDYEKVIEIFGQAVEIHGGNWWVCQYLAETCKANGDHARAMAVYRKTEMWHPTWALSHLRDLDYKGLQSTAGQLFQQTGTGLAFFK